MSNQWGSPDFEEIMVNMGATPIYDDSGFVGMRYQVKIGDLINKGIIDYRHLLKASNENPKYKNIIDRKILPEINQEYLNFLFNDMGNVYVTYDSKPPSKMLCVWQKIDTASHIENCKINAHELTQISFLYSLQSDTLDKTLIDQIYDSIKDPLRMEVELRILDENYRKMQKILVGLGAILVSEDIESALKEYEIPTRKFFDEQLSYLGEVIDNEMVPECLHFIFDKCRIELAYVRPKWPDAMCYTGLDRYSTANQLRKNVADKIKGI